MEGSTEFASVPTDFIATLKKTYRSEWDETAELLKFLDLLGVRNYSLSGTQEDPILQTFQPAVR